ncbi:Hypothetical predicted protein [Pelobates cultripes]|uniref:Uncharacterized protein n=1 Tax=Pelobates cultripes TaxID=61616 RepID=A0AAD1TQI0_PELCU|nr:Hypothetical predicted protein [Pelobates cultripes]
MGGGKKSCNSSFAPIFGQKPEKAQEPSLEHSPLESESEMSSQATSDRTETPLTRRGFIADFRKYVAEELDERLCPIIEGMVDLSARTQALETKMSEAMETVHAHGGELQD